MDKHDSAGDAADAAVVMGAGRGINAKSREDAQAEGVYVATLTGPREECRDDYIAMRDETFALEAQASEFREAKAWADMRALLKKVRRNRRTMKSMEEVKWVDEIQNLVTTAGKNFALDTLFAGSTYTATWYVGLIDSGSYTAVAVGDTMASHSGWTECVAYSNSTRVNAAWSAASSGSKALSSASSFSINGTATVKGCFMNTVSTKSGTTGTLYSAGLFSGGDKAVANGDTLNVSYTASL